MSSCFLYPEHRQKEFVVLPYIYSTSFTLYASSGHPSASFAAEWTNPAHPFSPHDSSTLIWAITWGFISAFSPVKSHSSYRAAARTVHNIPVFYKDITTSQRLYSLLRSVKSSCYMPSHTLFSLNRANVPSSRRRKVTKIQKEMKMDCNQWKRKLIS